MAAILAINKIVKLGLKVNGKSLRLGCFSLAMDERQKQPQHREKCLKSLLEDMDPSLLNKCLSAFIAET